MEKEDKLDSMMADLLGFENEYDILNQKSKTPEEIEKWCTKEDMPEVKRLLHLMKKGYEVQKISVVNNLDRYMQESGANEELFSLIIDSLIDWDDKLQKECAYSFIKPLELNLINKRNKEKVVKVAIQITTDDDNVENVELVDSWIKVLETVVSRVDMKFITENVINAIKDIPSLKNPLPKRQRGNRLVFCVAKHLGEENFDKDPQIQKLILQICQDNNYKIRRDGVIFLKEYFKYDRKRIVEHDRFKDVYLPELIDFLNDEDLHIQIDAIEAVTEILEELEEEQIENDFIPCILNFLDIENQSQIGVIRRIAKIIGQVVFKLEKVGLHMKYKQELTSFYKELTDHEDEEIRQMAVFNLPCFNLLYKSVQKEVNLNFQKLWVNFSEDENFDIKKCAAMSLHEAFQAADNDEDITLLKECFLSFILDDNREIILIMNKNLDIMIKKYGNKHTIEHFKGRTAYSENSPKRSGSGSIRHKDITPDSKSKNSKASGADDFTSAMALSSSKKGALQKKNTHLGIGSAYDVYDDDTTKLPPIYTTEDYTNELVYSDLLQRLMIFINNIRSYQGNWREHAKLIQNLSKVIHLFYMPEIHSCLVPMLVDFLYKGNKDIKEATCNCLAIILQYQHHSPSRDELLEIIKKELGQALSWTQRKTYIFFCRYTVQYMPSEFFKTHFMKDYIACSQDKVPHVRMEFANAMLIIKPFFDKDIDLSLELMDILQVLNSDTDRDVLEAVEHTDYELLQSRKKMKDCVDEASDNSKEEFQKKLVIREKIEQEERKKHVDDDEETKYDSNSFLADNKKWRNKNSKFSHLSRRPAGLSNNKTNVKYLDNKVINVNKGLNNNDGMGESKLKKKSTMKVSKTNSMNLVSETEFQKQRKNSIIIGGKDDQIKRYHAMVSSNNGTSNGIGGLKRAETTVGTSKNATKPRRNTVQLGNGFNHI